MECMNTFPNRTVLRLSGPDTLSLLERTVTNTVANWQSGEMRYGALLTPQGKIIADFLAVLSSGDILLDVHEDAAADLEKRLKMFRLRADVTIERAEDLCVVTGDWADVRSAELPPRQIVSVDAAVGPLLPGAWHAARLNADGGVAMGSVSNTSPLESGILPPKRWTGVEAPNCPLGSLLPNACSLAAGALKSARFV